MNDTKVLVADDHEIVRKGLCAAVENILGWKICAEATTGREAVKLAEKHSPHIAVLDLTMPELNGIDATIQIKKICPECEILIFTGHENEELIHQVFKAGARSYIIKTDGLQHFTAALQALRNRKSYFTTQVGEILFSRFMGEKPALPEGESRISGREREIIQLLAEGNANKEVASRLGISVKTVETHRAAIMKKLNLKAFSELVKYAIRNNIVSA